MYISVFTLFTGYSSKIGGKCRSCALLAGQWTSRQHISRVDLTLSILGPEVTVYIGIFTGYSSWIRGKCRSWVDGFLVQVCTVILAVVAGALLAGQGTPCQHISRVDLTLSDLGPVGTIYISIFTGYASRIRGKCRS